MSIEVALAENTAATKALTELLARLTAGGVLQSTERAVPTAPDAASPTPAESKAALAKRGEGKDLTAGEAAAALHGHATPEAKAEAAPPAAAPAPAAAPLTYEAAIKPLIVTMAKTKGRDAVVAVLKEFGVATGGELRESQWAAAAEAFKAALA